MTVALAKVCKKEGTVKFIEDSMVSNGAMDKVNNINKMYRQGSFVIAGAGDMNNYQIIKHSIQFPDDKTIAENNIEINPAFFINIFKPAVDNCIKYKNGMFSAVQLLIGYKDRLFEILDAMLSCFEIKEGYSAIGIARKEVLDYVKLVEQKDDESDERYMTSAMEFGISKKMGCGFPLYYTETTFGDTFYEINENGLMLPILGKGDSRW